MDIQLDCSCGQRFLIDSQYAGQAVACPTCGTAVVAPVPVRAAVKLERLPELKAQPTFSSYTLPPARGPSLWDQYKLWILGGFAALVLVALVTGAVVGLVWVSKYIEPRAPGQFRSDPVSEAPAPAATGRPPTGAGLQPVPPPATPPANDSDDYESDSSDAR